MLSHKSRTRFLVPFLALFLLSASAWAFDGGYYSKDPADNARALEAVRTKAESGDPRSQLMLGDMLRHGKPTDAVKWYRKAADQGKFYAQMRLSDLYVTGEGGKKDLKEAAFWCEIGMKYNPAPISSRRAYQLWEECEKREKTMSKAKKVAMQRRVEKWIKLHPAPPPENLK